MNRTPRQRVRGMLRQIFLRSNERNDTLKRDQYTCQECGVKKSVAKGKIQRVEVHHKEGVKVMNDMVDMVFNHLLVDPSLLETLCPDCHREKEE